MENNTIAKIIYSALVNVNPSRINKIVMMARKMLAENYTTYSAHQLEEIAQGQMKILFKKLTQTADKGMISRQKVNRIINCLKSKLPFAIARIKNKPIAKSNLPLLAVINSRYLKINIQICLLGGGANKIEEEVINLMEMPNDCAWWCIDVEDGSQFTENETAPEVEMEIIKDQGRKPIVCQEAIALGIQTKALDYHGIDAPASSIRDSEFIVSLSKDLGKPTLVLTDSQNDNGDEFGTASIIYRV